MKKIKLGGKIGKGKYALVDDEDFRLLSPFAWHLKSDGYVETTRKNKPCFLHVALLWYPKNGKYVIDHINGNKLDNRRKNLRIVSRSVNCRNKRLNSTSKTGEKCISFFPAGYKHGSSVLKQDMWRVVVNYKYLGMFPSLRTAKRVRNKYGKETEDFYLKNPHGKS